MMVEYFLQCIWECSPTLLNAHLLRRNANAFPPREVPWTFCFMILILCSFVRYSETLVVDKTHRLAKRSNKLSKSKEHIVSFFSQQVPSDSHSVHRTYSSSTRGVRLCELIFILPLDTMLWENVKQSSGYLQALDKINKWVSRIIIKCSQTKKVIHNLLSQVLVSYSSDITLSVTTQV